MADITALFWDVGGVLLTNGWDRVARGKLVKKFGLDGDDFEERHAAVVSAFERGQLSLERYLDQTIFCRPRSFTKPDVEEFIFAQSEPYPDALALVGRLAGSRKYLIATLNNESVELNQYRIDRFGLRKLFQVFLSSCFLGLRKPDEAIYRLALNITQRGPEEAVFVDDRRLNVEAARRLGMNAIEYQDTAQLEVELHKLGVVDF